MDWKTIYLICENGVSKEAFDTKAMAEQRQEELAYLHAYHVSIGHKVVAPEVTVCTMELPA